MGFSNFGGKRVEQARGAVFESFLNFVEFSLRHFPVRRPGTGAEFHTGLVVSESAEMTDPLIDAVVDELHNEAHPHRVELEEGQRALDERRIGSRLPQVDSDDDFVVAPEFVALLRRPPYSKRWLSRPREGRYWFGDLGVFFSVCMLNLSVSFRFDDY